MSPKSEPCKGGCGLAMPEPGMCVGCLEGARLVNGIAPDRLREELAEARAIGELETQINQKTFAIVAYEQVAGMLENLGPEFSQDGDAAALSAARRFCKSLAKGARGIVAKTRAEREALLLTRAATGEPKETT